MNQRFDADHQACFNAYRKAGDYENLQHALTALGNRDYETMKDHIRIMVADQCSFDVRYDDFVSPEEDEDEEEPVPAYECIPLRFDCGRPKPHVRTDNEELISEDRIAELLGEKPKPKVVEPSVESAPVVETKQKQDHETETPSVSIDAPSTSSIIPSPKIHKNNRIAKRVVINWVEAIDVKEGCDPTICDNCEPLPEGSFPSIEKNCVVVYAGPGAGKTQCQISLREQYGRRIRLYDTDHVKPDQKIPAKSIVFTNRADVLMSYDGARIAYLPYRRRWIRMCLSKCPGTKDSWYDDVVRLIKNSVVVRGNNYLSEDINFKL